MNPPVLVTDSSLDSINRALVALANVIPSSSDGATVLLQTSTWFIQNNPIPPSGQICLETDTKYFKFGDGKTAYASLAYQWKVPYFAAQAAGSYAPLPQSAAGVGYWVSWTGANGGALSLPAGGTWAYVVWFYNSATGVMSSAGAAVGLAANVAAGGTLMVNGNVGFTPQSMIYRLS